MLSKLFSPEDAVRVLDIKDVSDLQTAVDSGELKYGRKWPKETQICLKRPCDV